MNLCRIARTSPRAFRRVPVFRNPFGAACRASRKGSSCLAQRRTNTLDDDRQSADNELVGKSKNAKSRASKPCIPLVVLDLRSRRLVRAAVRFDDDFSRKTNEIREIGSDRRLSAEAVSVDLMIPHRAPKHGLRPRHVPTLHPSELARGLTETGWLVHLVYLSQDPFPTAGKTARPRTEIRRGRMEYGPLSEPAVALHDRHREAFSDGFLLSTPHPSPSATPSPLRGEGAR